LSNRLNLLEKGKTWTSQYSLGEGGHGGCDLNCEGEVDASVGQGTGMTGGRTNWFFKGSGKGRKCLEEAQTRQDMLGERIEGQALSAQWAAQGKFPPCPGNALMIEITAGEGGKRERNLWPSSPERDRAQQQQRKRKIKRAKEKKIHD